MKWIKFDINKKPDFNNYDHIIVKIKEPSDCCNYFVAVQFKYDKSIYSNCINHSQECGSHTIDWNEVDYWITLD